MRPKSIWDYDSECRRDASDGAKSLRLVQVQEEGKLARYLLVSRRWASAAVWSWVEVVVLHAGHLLVHGDIDAVIFGRCGGYESARQVLYWMANAESSYAREKASIGSSNKIATEWDAEVALWYVHEYGKEGILSDEQVGRLERELFQQNGQHEFVQALNDETGDFELLGAGTVTAREVYNAQAALRRLVEELEAIDFRKQSLAWFRRAA